MRLTGDDTDCIGDGKYFDFDDSGVMICADTCKTGFFKRETSTEYEVKICAEKEMCIQNNHTAFRVIGDLKECVEQCGSDEYFIPEIVDENTTLKYCYKECPEDRPQGGNHNECITC